MNIQTKNCKTCSKVFEKRITCSKKSWEITFFCSRPCQIKGRIYLKPRYKFPLGTIPWNKGLEGNCNNTGKTHFKKGQKAWNKDMKMSEEICLKMRVPRLNARGENHPRWLGGITPENMKIRHSLEYKLWRKEVFERDNYTCIICDQRGGDKIADHIKPFALFPELRFVLENGRTLCKPCDKIYGFKYKCNLSVEENKALCKL